MSFRVIRRRTAGATWQFLVSGEWSESPYHQGTHSFLVRHSEDKKHWALFSRSSNRIIAAAASPDPMSIEVAGAAMLRAAEDRGGDFIDAVHRYGLIDEALFKQQWRTL